MNWQHRLFARGRRAIVVWRPATAVLLVMLALPPDVGAQEASSQQQALPADYLIGAGDTLTVDVQNEPEISRTVIVRPDGRISLPLVQDVMAVGRTPADLAGDIEASLAIYFRDPIVTITVANAVGLLSEQIRIVGEVVTPTAIPFRAGMTLLDAIQATGGLSPQASGNRARIIRRSEGTSEQIPIRISDLVQRGDIGANIALAPGDIIVVPEGFLAGTVDITRAWSAQIELSDNIDLDPDGQEEEGVIISLGPIVGVRANYARLTANADAALAVEQVSAGEDKGLRLDPAVNGFATAELLEDLLFFDAAASVRRQLLDTGTAGAESDEELVQIYSASPFLVNRFGNFATSETRYRFTQVLVSGGGGGGDVDDSQRHEGILTVDSGPRFTRFGWTFLARAFVENETGDGSNINDDDAEGWLVDYAVEYPVVRTFALLGAIGYEKFKDNDTDIDGATWRSGFRWRPSPRLDLEATYGRRDGDESFAGSVNYQVTPRTRVFGSYEETLETQVDELAGSLSSIGVDPDTGELVDLNTGLAFDPSTTTTTVVNDVTRTKTFAGGLVSTIGLNGFRLLGSFEQEEDEATGDNIEDTIIVEGQWTRSLTPRLTSKVIASFENNQFRNANGEETEYQISGGFDYRISASLTGTSRYSYRMQDADNKLNEFAENRIVLGLVGRF